MRLFGLIGNPVAHSQSPDYFHRLWAEEGTDGCRYGLFPLQDLKELPSLLREHPELQGLNVTSPFKEEVLAFADTADEAAIRLRSANVLCIRQGKAYAEESGTAGIRV